MIITIDGESKCGKTAFADAVVRASVAAFPWCHVRPFSIGNIYRAIAHATREAGGVLPDSDAELLRPGTEIFESLIEQGGIQSLAGLDLSTNSLAAAEAEIHRLAFHCFHRWLRGCYKAGNAPDASLLVLDARNPLSTWFVGPFVGHLKGQIPKCRIAPVYMETTIVSAAARMADRSTSSLTSLEKRRWLDLNRSIHPFIPVDRVLCETDPATWLLESRTTSDFARPLFIDNSSLKMDALEELAGRVAARVHSVAVAMADRGSGSVGDEPHRIATCFHDVDL